MTSSVVKTVMGKFRSKEGVLSCLTSEEFENLNSIGYSGKTLNGEKLDYQSYLNSLGKGIWILVCIKGNSGDFTEEYVVAHEDFTPKAQVSSELSKGDIIQVTDPDHPWCGVLLVVSEIKSWGVQAYCAIPNSNVENKIGMAYNRLKTGQFERVGRVLLVPGDPDEEGKSNG